MEQLVDACVYRDADERRDIFGFLDSPERRLIRVHLLNSEPVTKRSAYILQIFISFSLHVELLRGVQQPALFWHRHQLRWDVPDAALLHVLVHQQLKRLDFGRCVCNKEETV